MSRPIVGASWLLVTGLALALGMAAGPARAQQAAGQQPAAGGAKAPAVRQPGGGHLWWNDEAVIAKLSLSSEQRKQMDGLLDALRRQRVGNAMKAREAFHTALRQGKLEQARTELAAWAEAESAQVTSAGGLKIEVLGLLTAEQRQKLQTLHPDLVGIVWVPRPAWTAPPQQRAPVQR